MTRDETLLAAPRRFDMRAQYLLFAMLVALVVVPAALSLRSSPVVPDLPLTEDAYYAFSVSWNVAHGHGVTIDGDQTTNGFQPLFTFLTVPVFWFGRVTALRLILAIQAMVFTATAFLLASVVADGWRGAQHLKRSTVVLSVAVLYLSASFLMRTHLNGLESGFLLFMYAVFWRAYQLRGLRSTRDALVLGGIGGLIVLTRIDSMFVLAAFAVVHLAVNRQQARLSLRNLGIVAGSSIVVSLPWWAFNLIRFGSLMPTSGKAEQDWALDPVRVKYLVGGVFQAVTPWLYFGDHFPRYWPVCALAMAIGVAAYVVLRSRSSVSAAPPAALPGGSRCERADAFAWALVAGGLALGAWYTVSSWAVHFYPRYLALLALPALYVWARLVLAVTNSLPKLALASLGAAALIGVAYSGTFFDPSHFAGSDFYRHQLELAERVVPPNETVAGFQSGTLGYFRDGTLNLDGKVNADALASSRNVEAYLAREDVSFICDWPSNIEQLGDDALEQRWTFIAREGTFECYQRTAPASAVAEAAEVAAP